jgi:ubiquitin-protein ligase
MTANTNTENFNQYTGNLYRVCLDMLTKKVAPVEDIQAYYRETYGLIFDAMFEDGIIESKVVYPTTLPLNPPRYFWPETVTDDFTDFK